jgi:8-oxo-dGTP pyrophosphatase MutT (NUDIX family)
LRQSERGIECLLINQIDDILDTEEYWTFPKGTPEHGETPLETAVRETREETGLMCEDIDHEFTYDDHYSFRVGFTRINKIVTYFIGRVHDGEVRVQNTEVRDFIWLPLTEARAKLTNDQARSIIDAITAYLPQSRLFA